MSAGLTRSVDQFALMEVSAAILQTGGSGYCLSEVGKPHDVVQTDRQESLGLDVPVQISIVSP